MADQATQTARIEGPLERCFDVATDFERYPEWAKDVKHADVVGRDDEGRATEVAFQASAMGRTTSYTLHYDYTGAPERLSWSLVAGDLMRACNGTYSFSRAGDDVGPATDVEYLLEIELVLPLPGFVKRRAEVRILNTLKELKTRVESPAG